MRDVLHGRGKGVVPGDRGSAWFKLMTPLHYIVEEYKDHRYESGQRQQFLFAFGTFREIVDFSLVQKFPNAL